MLSELMKGFRPPTSTAVCNPFSITNGKMSGLFLQAAPHRVNLLDCQQEGTLQWAQPVAGGMMIGTNDKIFQLLIPCAWMTQARETPVGAALCCLGAWSPLSRDPGSSPNPSPGLILQSNTLLNNRNATIRYNTVVFSTQ